MGHVQSRAKASTGTVHTNNFLVDPISGNCIKVWIRQGSGNVITPVVTDSQGNIYNEVTGPGGFNNAASRRSYLFLAENIVGGAITVTLTAPQSVTWRFTIDEYDDVPPSNVIADFAIGSFSSTTAPASANVATAQANSTIAGGIALDTASSSIAAAGGSTERAEVDVLAQIQDKGVGALGSYNSQWTLGNAQAGTVFALALNPASSSPPSIANVDTDNIVTPGQVCNVNGANFGPDGANAKVEIFDGSIVSTCTKGAWASGVIGITVVQGNCRYGTITLKVTTQAGVTVTKDITLTTVSGKFYNNIGTLKALSFDARNRPTRLTPKGSAGDASADLTGAGQIEVTRNSGSGNVSIDPDARMQWDDTVTQVQFRWHNGTVWSSQIVWDVRGPFPTFLGPNIQNIVFTRNVAITPIDFSPLFADPDSPSGNTWSIQGGAVTGLSINSSGVMSGNPTVANNNTNRWIRRQDSEGSFADSNLFNINVEEPPNPPAFAGTIGPLIQSFDDATFTPLNTGAFFQFCTAFSLAGSLPPRLSFNTGTGIIRGTATTPGLYGSLQVTGTGTGTPAVSNVFAIEIVLPIPDINGTLPDLLFNDDDTNHNVDCAAGVFGATSFSISPAVPGTSSFNTTSGLLTFKSDTVGVFGPYTVTCISNGGSAPRNAFTVVVDPLMATDGNLSRTPSENIVQKMAFSIVDMVRNFA